VERDFDHDNLGSIKITIDNGRCSCGYDTGKRKPRPRFQGMTINMGTAIAGQVEP
jgi:hypothetical protein